MRAMHSPLGIALLIVAGVFAVALVSSLIAALIALTLFLVRRSRD
jgi:hypothetical protein